MNIIQRAFQDLFPEKEFRYSSAIKYSRKFSDYNANVKMKGNNLEFCLSHLWKDVDEDIKMGLIQSLLLKLLKEKKQTKYLDYYNTFIKKLSDFSPVTESDPLLEESFNRVNENYFFSLIDRPNLCFGSFSRRTLGTYNYHTDTIKISLVLKDAPKKMMDYVMYHEILHKKIKFKQTDSGRALHHTKDFRKKEREFEGSQQIEKELENFVSKAGKKKLWGLF